MTALLSVHLMEPRLAPPHIGSSEKTCGDVDALRLCLVMPLVEIASLRRQDPRRHSQAQLDAPDGIE
jgi:hypothetical protein